jgi:hypothetical protein
LDCYCSYECANAAKNKNKPTSKPVNKPTPQVKRKQTKINQVSKTNKCICSDGTVYTTYELNVRIKKAKQQKIDLMEREFGYIFCEDCVDFGVPEKANPMELKIIDCSHEVSVDEAKKSGRSELAFEVKNIRMRCRVHHRKHDKTE